MKTVQIRLLDTKLSKSKTKVYTFKQVDVYAKVFTEAKTADDLFIKLRDLMVKAQ